MSLVDPTEAAIGPESVKLGAWQRRLRVYQRVAGGFMMCKGLVQWASLLGVADGAGARFLDFPVEAQSVIVFFAVVDIITGVGLWLGSTWGGVMWVIAAALQVAAGAVLVELSGFLVLMTIIEILMLALYVVARLMEHFEEVR